MSIELELFPYDIVFAFKCDKHGRDCREVLFILKQLITPCDDIVIYEGNEPVEGRMHAHKEYHLTVMISAKDIYKWNQHAGRDVYRKPMWVHEQVDRRFAYIGKLKQLTQHTPLKLCKLVKGGFTLHEQEMRRILL